jgi:subtilisin-like proprotein convertase family protein
MSSKVFHSIREFRLGSAVSLVALCMAWGALSSDAARGDAAGKPNPLPVTNKQAETSEMLVFLNPGVDAATFATDHGLTVVYGLQSDPNAFVFSTGSANTLTNAVNTVQTDPRILSAAENAHTQYSLYSFAPNDPYFHHNTPAAGWPGQWHLSNEITPGLDANVLGAWQNYTGQGVTIGIVDDCLETAHPDLAPNYVAADSWNFGSNNNNPNPVNSTDQHGISVAGVAAARGNNGIGVTGAAPFANLAGLRIDFPTQTTAMFVDATLYHSSGSNTTVKVENHSYGITTPFVDSTLERNALATSTAAGTIHCFAAGNDRGTTGDDSNKKSLQASPDSITVAALDSTGKFAYYSCFGANVFVTAPSNGGYGITTTDRTGALGYNTPTSDSFPDDNYTSAFGGTSSATPLVTGVLALVKQAQPNLNTRFAKHLLVRTSKIVDPTDSTITGGGNGSTAGSAWKTNAAGHAFNENYGFGMIDATALTQQAQLYSGVTPLQTYSTGMLTVGAAIPDGNTAGISRSVSISQTTALEDVLVTLNATHTWRGDLEAYLTSPNGTTSRLMYNATDGDSDDNINWQFDSNAFWGENPNGIWSLKVDDWVTQDSGTWNSWSLQLRMGDLIAVPEPAGWMLLAVVAATVGLARFRRR